MTTCNQKVKKEIGRISNMLTVIVSNAESLCMDSEIKNEAGTILAAVNRIEESLKYIRTVIHGR